MIHQDLFRLQQLPHRTQKPRDSGITMVMDKGLSLLEAESLCEVGEHTIDLVKLGFGTSLVTPKLKEKIAIYHENGFKVYLGGTLFEAYMVRNQLDDYIRLVDALGLTTLEVSDGSIDIPHAEKCEIIHKLSKNFTVLSEVGSKDAEKVIPPYSWIEMMQNELQAGTWKVIAEARESGTVGVFRGTGEVRSGLVAEIIRKVNEDNIIWEAPLKNQQLFFIKLLGANVNLGNISTHEILSLEALRIGLRGDTFELFLNLNSNKPS
jgi:phosphosulfolactate synthase